MATLMKYNVVHLVVMLILVVVQNRFVMAQSNLQTCSSSLDTCAPFVVPGTASTPSPGCCLALRSVDYDCLCSTLRIAARIPAMCNLPPLSCGGN